MMRRLAAGVLSAVLAAFGTIGGAAAQGLISIATDDPSFISLGAGAFDFDHNFTAGDFRAEFRSNYKLLYVLKPMIGIEATTDKAYYAFFGFNADIYFGNRFVATPNAAIGYFDKGNGKDLGARAEFRTGSEFAYRFDDHSRLGVYFNHISNAGFTKRNPGTEIVGVAYSIPFTLLK
jgi:lipid A 3-O-deacylase